MLLFTDDVLSQNCSTVEDFESLAATVADVLVSKHGDHPLYAKFVESFVKSICAPLKDVETRKAASALTTLANEKQKAQKDAQGGKKKKASKPALGAAKNVSSRAADVGAYDEILDDSGDYDDFVSPIARRRLRRRLTCVRVQM